MKIKKLKINAFGNLKEKEIEFTDNINIVQGNNESGKSTLLKFITNIFYGTSKNKKGKEFSDYERYKPWLGEEFSGKLSYTLDNGETYEVFRDFNKKNPKIYNEDLEDISKQFTIDKTYGNQFFIEQTNVDEPMFFSCLVSMQQEVKIDRNVQNAMVQKVANLAGTGDDSISYKKVQEKLNKKQIEEIGTPRSQGRPINVVKDEKYKLQDEIGELEEFKQRKQEIEKEKEEKQEILFEIEEKIELIKKVKTIKEIEKLELEKIKISENLKTSQEERKKQLQKEKNEILQEQENIKPKKQEISKNNTKRNMAICILVTSILLEILNLIFIKNTIIMFIFLVSSLFSIVFILIENKKEKAIKKRNYEEKQKEIIKSEDLKRKLEKVQTEINVLQANIEENQKEIENKKQNIIENQKNKTEKILQSSSKKELIEELFELSNIQFELEKLQEERNTKKLEYHSLELEENTIKPKLEKIALLEEQLEDLNDKEKKLEKDNLAIELAKEILETAYQKMKQNVTPKLTEKLSQNIQKISNNEYTKVNLHEEKGIIIEKDNGEYIEVEKLSIGTIDQLYLSLRLAMAKELCKETMPIILDEAFAYYDEKRLENILTYLNNEFKNNQIIIFTCTNREKTLLEKNLIKYNLINSY